MLANFQHVYYERSCGLENCPKMWHNTAADPPVSPAPAATQLSRFTPAEKEEVAGVTARSQAECPGAAQLQPGHSPAALNQQLLY